MRTDQFRYVLPESAIAQQPVEPRHHARLLDADRLADLRFDDLPLLLTPGDLLVVNSTRVRPARLLGNKEPTGGKVEALLLRRLDGDHWEALVRPARRLREGSAVRFGPLQATVTAGPTDGRVVLRMGTADGIDVDDLLAQVGEVPLPPYIHTPLSDPERYQTVFAKVPGSAAAPTAGLHFTPRVLEAVGEAGVEVAEVDLEVGLDSFRPITTPDISGHRMHHERFSVPEPTAQAVEATRRRGGRVVAVGTTVVRALESAALADGRVRATSEDTGLFITPGYHFRVVDALVTNFHAPGSTLLVLLGAFMGPAWRQAYDHALRSGYRFLSFGDAMFVRRDHSGEE